MKIKTDGLRVPEGKPVDLAKYDTRTKPVYANEDEHDAVRREQTKALADLQELLYAANKHSLLVIFQAMDAAGKDGAIKHVLSGINPQGVEVYSFKQPSATELDHDFLWRTYRCLPERGRIGVFNRSYYEEVLVVRVHPEYLAAQNLPTENADPKTLWRDRFRSIRDMEAHLHRSGTRIVKFFLHVSKGEQRKRFLARVDTPEKNWKFNAGDIAERAHWKDYMAAYADCLAETSTKQSPWYIIPADDKENARLLVSQVLLETLKSLKMQYPTLSPAEQASLAAARATLAKE